MHSRLLALAAILALALSGCADDVKSPLEDETPPPPVTAPGPELGPGIFAAPRNATFLPLVIDVAVHQGHGLYEPTIDVGRDGVIYVSAHSTGVGVVPAPGYISTDDGATWANLATVGPVQNPGPGQTAGGPFSDEIFIVAGADGQAWGVDINLHSFLIGGWCSHGAEACYYNPQAYDHTQLANEQNDCTPLPLKDRPWAAYANGTLFIVNNPGGGPAQIAVMQVPPAVPVEVGHVASDIQWNLCADGGGGIPGIPDIRDDGLFAVAHQQGSQYVATTGWASDIYTTRESFVFNNTHTAPSESDSTPSEIGRYGQAAFDGDGNLWFAAMNNTQSATKGGIHIAFSDDEGESFVDRIFRVQGGVSSVYIDGNKNGHGALVNWGEVDGANTDWYFGHLVIDAAGELVLQNVMLAFDDGPEASRHVQGAALGPDGRAYMVMSDVSGNDDQAMAAALGTTPMRVVVQQDGPLLA
jgi:hypothetical protein